MHVTTDRDKAPASRRNLPSMASLQALEAAERLGSFTLAGRELDLTQSAVSRQIRALEATLGAPLFLRERQTVTATRQGRAYAEQIRAALRMVGAATRAFRAKAGDRALNLAVLPTFGARWLAPRLSDFLSRHPAVAVNLTTRLTRFDFRAERLDAAIHFGEADWPNAEMAPLMREEVAPVCSPALARRLGLARPADLADAPLLLLASRPYAWARWFARQGVSRDDIGGMAFDQFALAAQAAISGLGVALLPTFLIEEELARGELVAPVGGAMESAERYYLVWPKGRPDNPALTAFRAWLESRVASEGSGRALSAD